MLNVLKTAPDRIEIELMGPLGVDEMRAALEELFSVSEGMEKANILYKISDFEMPTLGAMAIEVQKMPQLLELTKKFNKCAVLSDTAWIRSAAEIEGVIIPSIAIKSFLMDETGAAKAWLDGVTDEDNADDAFENMPV